MDQGDGLRIFAFDLELIADGLDDDRLIRAAGAFVFLRLLLGLLWVGELAATVAGARFVPPCSTVAILLFVTLLLGLGVLLGVGLFFLCLIEGVQHAS